MAEIMRFGRFVRRCVCAQDYCKSNQPILLKRSVTIGPTNRKNWLTFGPGYGLLPAIR